MEFQMTCEWKCGVTRRQVRNVTICCLLTLSIFRPICTEDNSAAISHPARTVHSHGVNLTDVFRNYSNETRVVIVVKSSGGLRIWPRNWFQRYTTVSGRCASSNDCEKSFGSSAICILSGADITASYESMTTNSYEEAEPVLTGTCLLRRRYHNQGTPSIEEQAALVPYGETCEDSWQCSGYPFSTCDGGKCRCVDHYVYVSEFSRCMRAASLFESCQSNTQCERKTPNSFCDASFSTPQCYCKYPYIFNPPDRCIRYVPPSSKTRPTKAQEVYRVAMIAGCCFLIAIIGILMTYIVRKAFCTRGRRLPGGISPEDDVYSIENDPRFAGMDKPPSYLDVVREVEAQYGVPPPAYDSLPSTSADPNRRHRISRRGSRRGASRISGLVSHLTPNHGTAHASTSSPLGPGRSPASRPGPSAPELSTPIPSASSTSTQEHSSVDTSNTFNSGIPSLPSTSNATMHDVLLQESESEGATGNNNRGSNNPGYIED